MTLSRMYLQAYCMSYSCLKYMLVPAFEWQTQPMQLWKLTALIPNWQSWALLLEPSTKSYFASEKVKLIPFF